VSDPLVEFEDSANIDAEAHKDKAAERGSGTRRVEEELPPTFGVIGGDHSVPPQAGSTSGTSRGCVGPKSTTQVYLLRATPSSLGRAGDSLHPMSGVIEPVSDIEVENITAIRVDGVWIEVEPGSISSHQFRVDPSVVAGAGIGFRAIDTPITSRHREATYVLVSAITAVRTREDGPGNLGHSR
jgi:hypothetical protein